MKKTQKIELNLGKPKNGWLPIELYLAGLELKFVVSKIPSNPTRELCDTLISVMKNVESECRWNLEPKEYILRLTPNRNGIGFTVYKNGEANSEKLVAEHNGDFENIVLPLYRSLKKFETMDFNETDWTKIERIRMDKLTELIAARKRTEFL